MITLRNYTEADIDRLVTLANNKNVSRYLVDTFPYPYTTADAAWWIATGSKANDAVTKVIEYRGEFIGSVGVHPQSGWKSHVGEIGYWIGEDYWGKGLATMALKSMTETAFTLPALKKLFAPVLAPNQPSKRVLEKCGYHLEGVLKQEVFKDDNYYDIYQYALHRP
jgi:ribosomal-protein-alanine N-acetyltransferase